MVVLGHDNTLAVTVDEMLHHTRAVRRGLRRALVVADMPFGSYHGTVAEGVANAVRFVKEAGAEAVKIEGGRARRTRRSASPKPRFPSSAHIGLTPQSVHRMGGYRVQATLASIRCCASRPTPTRSPMPAPSPSCSKACPAKSPPPSPPSCAIPTIGIGAGPECDGQILVFHDLVNMTFAPPAKFVRRYADAAALIRSAVEHYREDVERRAFPSDEESYHLAAPGPQSLGLDPADDEIDTLVNKDALHDF